VSKMISGMERIVSAKSTSRFAQMFNLQSGDTKIINRDVLTGLGLLALFAGILVIVQFATPNLAGNDGYYHVKMAYLIRTHGFKPDFEWLPLTVLNASEYVNHHFLYHIFLLPFTFGDLRVGVKVASVIFPSLTFVSIWWLLKQQKIPFAAIWTLGLLAISTAFLYRMIMPRAQSLSLAVLVLALHWVLTGRFRRLLPLAFFYVWMYNAFPLIIVVSGAYTAAVVLIEKRWVWRPLLYAGAGVVLGLIINPYFPENLIFIYRHLGPKLLDATSLSVGNEWYPYSTAQLLENSGLALGIFLSGILALGLSGQRMKISTATNFFLVTIFGFMLFQSRRFIEYAPPFVLVFAALAWQPFIQTWLSRSKSNIAESRTQGVQSGSRFLPTLISGGLLILILPILWSSVIFSRKDLQESTAPYDRFGEASGWLENNTEAGSIIFQTDWDDFPRLFFYNSSNRYTLGLDPIYMQLYDDGLYDQWVAITNGEVENPAAIIRDIFGAQSVLSDLKHSQFLKVAEEDPGLVETFRDNYAVVFTVLP
jgi:hypothetical protein